MMNFRAAAMLGCSQRMRRSSGSLCPHMAGRRAEGALGFPDGSDGEESACNVGDHFDPWVGKIPWRRKWQPTPVFLPGKFHG